ncbi:MAG TPA: phytanoyl-CoA dioxygenase family protein [Acidimicrobiales bacterium]|nr:phytanoyl-CoA dioxygenase family protein [Acidimicrobiales bacterium]
MSPVSVDVRTRVDGEQESVDAASVFEDQLPGALHAGAALLEPAVGALGLLPLVIEVGDSSWTLLADAGRVGIRTGPIDGDRALRLRLDDSQIADLVHDQVTPMGWFSSGTLALEGRLERLLDWWLVLRGALDQRAPHVGEAPPFVDRDGAPLDLARTFAWGDDDEDMAHFLHEAGFLHVAGVFTEDEMAGVSADMDRAAPTYHQGDGRSWWARTAAGEDRLVRMQGFDAMSEHAAGLMTDGRLARLGALTGDGHQWGGMDGNALEALVKPIGIVEGISDVPWHKDCSLGRHSYECSSLTVGISVTGADATSGQLRVVAGSNRVFVWPAFVRRDNTLPLVDLPTGTGDVTLHLSCTMHMAQPPVERERRVMYTGFRLPPLRPDAAADARRRLRAVRETAAVTVSQPPSTVVG